MWKYFSEPNSNLFDKKNKNLMGCTQTTIGSHQLSCGKS